MIDETWSVRELEFDEPLRSRRATPASRRALLFRLGIGYTVVCIAIALIGGPHVHSDTPGYLDYPASFLGKQPRPWVPSLPMHVLGGYGFVAFQAALSGIAFFVLSLAVASALKDRRFQLAAMAVVLLLGITPRTTSWDVMLLSESMAISFTALLIACFVWLRRTPWWGYGLVFTLWLLTREAHLYLGVLVLAGVTVWGWRQRRWAVPVVTAVALLWGCITYGNNRWVEHLNVTINLAFYAGGDVDTYRWYIDHGMPRSSAFMITDYEQRHMALQTDPEFQAWVARDGENTYTEFLVTHPKFLVAGPLTAMFTNRSYGGDSLVDHSQFNMAHAIGVPWFWPERAAQFNAILLVVTGVLTLLVVSRHVIDKRGAIPLALLVSTGPHALLAYHAVPSEFARHGTVLGFVLVLSCWWMVLLAAEALTRERVVGSQTRARFLSRRSD